MSTLLSTNKSLRKSQPMARGLLDYFPRALAAVSNVSFVANEQHNPGEEMHWAKEKSTDHADCILRHMVDRGRVDDDGLRHSAKLAWRALALLETELELQDTPDRYCITAANGDCISTDPRCMHQPRGDTVPPSKLADDLEEQAWKTPHVAKYLALPESERPFGAILRGQPVPYGDAVAQATHHTFTNHIMAEPESTRKPPFDLPQLLPWQTVNQHGEIVDLDAMFPSNDSNDRVHGRPVPPETDADACGTTDGTTPIEYRVNYASQAGGTTNTDKSHWIVRGDVIRFFDLNVGTETDEAGGLELDEIRRGLLSGSFVFCDEYGTALPCTSSHGEAL